MSTNTGWRVALLEGPGDQTNNEGFPSLTLINCSHTKVYRTWQSPFWVFPKKRFGEAEFVRRVPYSLGQVFLENNGEASGYKCPCRNSQCQNQHSLRKPSLWGVIMLVILSGWAKRLIRTEEMRKGPCGTKKWSFGGLAAERGLVMEILMDNKTEFKWWRLSCPLGNCFINNLHCV